MNAEDIGYGENPERVRQPLLGWSMERMCLSNPNPNGGMAILDKKLSSWMTWTPMCLDTISRYGQTNGPALER